MFFAAKKPLIGVVGNCAAGKTTLVKGLQELGYEAVNIAQEHSGIPRFWRKFNVDFLVMLSCTVETARRRRQVPWGQERLDQQAIRLADARAHCHLYLPTDDLTIAQVRQQVVAAVAAWQEEDGNEDRKNHTGGCQTPSAGGDIFTARQR